MNNKGFAITGVLYTVFILFIMILLSMLSGLNHKMQLMEKSISSYIDGYKASDVSDTDSSCNVTNMNLQRKADCTGKYIFSISNNSDVVCIAYLKKGTSFASSLITFVANTEDNTKCVNARNESKLVLGAVYKFS